MNGKLVTVAGPDGSETIIGLKLTPALVAKTAACAILTTMGLHAISTGKRDRDAGRIVRGGIMVLLGLLAFSV